MLRSYVTRHKNVSLVVLFVVSLMLTSTMVMAADVPAPSGDPGIIPPGAKVELLFDGAEFFLEGPAMAPDNTLYFSDITVSYAAGMQAGHIWKYDPATGETTIFRSPSGMANGIQFDAQGRLLVAEGADFGGQRITRTEMKTGKATIIAATYNGFPLNAPNDLSIDEKGRIYFTDPRYHGREPVEQSVFGVYRIDPDNSIHLIIADAGMPNGVSVSPDQKTLYVISTDIGAMDQRLPEGLSARPGLKALLAYDLNPDGTATFREILVDYAPGYADGMACDVEGNLYVAVSVSETPGIYVYSPQGQQLAVIPTDPGPANCAFGRGEYSKTLYITSVNKLFKIELMKDGYQLPPVE